jgi:hypothetical protein
MVSGPIARGTSETQAETPRTPPGTTPPKHAESPTSRSCSTALHRQAGDRPSYLRGTEVSGEGTLTVPAWRPQRLTEWIHQGPKGDGLGLPPPKRPRPRSGATSRSFWSPCSPTKLPLVQADPWEPTHSAINREHPSYPFEWVSEARGTRGTKGTSSGGQTDEAGGGRSPSSQFKGPTLQAQW